MTSLRLWIVLLAAMTFLGGMAAGRWTAAAEVRTADRRGAFEDYARLLEERFQLDGRRARNLRIVLESYERDLERLREERLQAYWSAIEPDLRDLTREYEGYIRDRVLPPDRRGDFDAAGTSVAVPPAAPASPSTDPSPDTSR